MSAGLGSYWGGNWPWGEPTGEQGHQGSGPEVNLVSPAPPLPYCLVFLLLDYSPNRCRGCAVRKAGSTALSLACWGPQCCVWSLDGAGRVETQGRGRKGSIITGVSQQLCFGHSDMKAAPQNCHQGATLSGGMNLLLQEGPAWQGEGSTVNQVHSSLK